jgi:hypothetical protein
MPKMKNTGTDAVVWGDFADRTTVEDGWQRYCSLRASRRPLQIKISTTFLLSMGA